MKIGIIGLPASGKTTLFNALTGVAASTGGYSGARVNMGVAQVPDMRVDALSEIFRRKKTVHATVEFADVPGMGEQKEAATAKGGADAIPQALEGADALLLVVRAFEDPSVPHPKDSVDPSRDMNDVRFDLMFRDLAVVERRVERLEKTVPTKKDPAEAAELEILRELKDRLEAGEPISACELSEEQRQRLQGFGFLSAKPLLVAVNIGENQVGADAGEAGFEAPSGVYSPISLCAKLEEELVQLSVEDRAEFLSDYALESPAGERVIQASFELLGLQCFFTVGEDEVRSWPIRKGATALHAAGVIHSDLERGFIRAEVVSYDAFMEAGSLAAARERGVLRLEGRDYLVQDGDIMNIRFNV